MTPAVDDGIGAARQRRAWWLKTLHQWHWISSAVCLVGLLLFTVTGITLNHASQIEASPQVTTRTAQLPASLLAMLAADAHPGTETGGDSTLPRAVADWLEQTLPVRIASRAAEWSEGEIYVPLPRPGGDAWLSIDTVGGLVEYERTDRGWVSWLNDLHKGRNTGGAWRWFIDLFAVASLVFCLTGLFLLQLHARQRAATWPVVGLGLVLPLLIILLFIH